MVDRYRFPRDIAKIICGYAETWQFLPWVEELARIPRNARIIRNEMMRLWENRNGIDMALRENIPMSWQHLSANPSPWAVARIIANPEKVCWDLARGNSGLYDAIADGIVRVGPIPDVRYCTDPKDPDYLASNLAWGGRLCGKNSSKSALPILLDQNGRILVTFCMKSYIPANPHPLIVPQAIKLGWCNDNPIAWENPNGDMLAFMLSERGPGPEQIDWGHLSANENPVAIEMLRQSPEKINWSAFLTNAGIFEPRVDAGVLDALTW